MFGFNAESMVKRGKWEKLTAVVEKKDMSKVPAIAAACAKSREDGAYNTLITMLNSDSVECKIAAVKALGEQGRPAAVTQLMYQSKAADSEELKSAIAVALEQLHNRKEEE